MSQLQKSSRAASQNPISTVSDESNRVLWIDWDGSMITEAAKLCERIRRLDFGHLGSK
jgi:hypothetical protein